MNFEDAWQFLHELEPKKAQTKKGIWFVYTIDNKRIRYFPRDGVGEKKPQSKARFKQYFDIYFAKKRRAKTDFLNDSGKRSQSGNYSYFIPLFQLIEKQTLNKHRQISQPS